jgi:nucleoside-diphosphate-sugar epimerase
MKEVLTMIAQALGKQPPTIRANPLILRLSLAFEWLRSITGKYPRYTRALARNAFSQHRFENNKVRDALGFEFRDLQQTIQWTAQALLHHER